MEQKGTATTVPRSFGAGVSRDACGPMGRETGSSRTSPGGWDVQGNREEGAMKAITMNAAVCMRTRIGSVSPAIDSAGMESLRGKE